LKSESQLEQSLQKSLEFGNGCVFFVDDCFLVMVKKDYYPCFEIVIIFKQITMKISSNLRGFFVALHFYP